jgi:predicted enzyme related to lactoylglutathione lyase
VTSSIHNITVYSRDPQRVATFWAAVTGWPATLAYEDEYGPEYAVGPGGGHIKLYFVPVPEPKTVKNRMHLDIAPDDCTQDEEIARLTGLGASIVNDPRPEFGWVTMADPEGNEFDLEKSPTERLADEDS